MPNPKWEVYENKATGIEYDLTDADAQSQLTAIKDGTTIDSFGDVETALSTKYDINDESQISILDYDYVPYYADAESATRKIYWTNIKNGLKSFFDDLYCAIGLVPSGASSSNKLATASDVADRVDWSSYAKTGVHQRIPFPYKETTKTQNGVTVTVNSNRSITIDIVSGGATANTVFNIIGEYSVADSRLSDLRGNYTVDIENAIPANSNIAVNMRTSVGTNLWSINNGQSKITVNSTDAEHFFGCMYIYIPKNAEVSDWTINPLIKPAEDKSDERTPYAMTNKELTEKVQGIINAATNAADFAAFKTAIGNL